MECEVKEEEEWKTIFLVKWGYPCKIKEDEKTKFGVGIILYVRLK